jgi:hypothetical protein
MADFNRTSTNRVVKVVVALVTIFGLLFMHGVTASVAASAHCAETSDVAAQPHHESMGNHHHDEGADAEGPSTDHDACGYGHGQHTCVGTTRKSVEVNPDASSFAIPYAVTAAGPPNAFPQLRHVGLPPPMPDLDALCISRT